MHFMAQNEQENDVNNVDVSYVELYEYFEQLFDDSIKLSKSYFALNYKYD